MIILGAITFPPLVLLPFLVHSSQRYFVIAASFVTPWCNSLGSVSKVRQCTMWDTPTSMHWIGLLGVLAVSITGGLALFYIRKHGTKAMKRYTTAYLLTAVAVIILSVCLYVVMRSFSQAGRFFTTNQLSNDNWVVIDPAPLGYGLNPAWVVLLAALYLVVPLMSWYRWLIPGRIAGVKKKELFQ